MNELKKESDIKDYMAKNKDDLINVSLSEYLQEMLDKYNIKKNNAIRKSELDLIYGYQIFSGKRKNPSRDKLIQLIFSMEMDITDAQRLLKIAGVNELYPRVKRDSVIIFAINKKISLYQCDELLLECGEKTIL